MRNEVMSNQTKIDDRIQFARLIDEMIAALPPGEQRGMIKDMAVSMDLSEQEVNTMIKRAMLTWENAKP